MEYYKEENHLDVYYFIYEGQQQVIQSLLESLCKEKIQLSDYRDKYEVNFQKEYIDFIGKLSRRYHSFFWWAGSLPEKNTFISDLHRKIYFCSIVLKIILFEDFPFLLIFNDDIRVIDVIRRFCTKNKINTSLINLVNSNQITKHTKIIEFPKNIIFYLRYNLKSIIRKLRNTHKSVRKNDIPKNQEYYVLRTWFDERTVHSIKNLRDTYFGRLPEYLINKGEKVIILAGIMGNSLDISDLIRSLRYRNLLIIPENAFVKLRDYITSHFLSQLLKIRLRAPIHYRNIDVSPLILKEYSHSHILKVKESLLRGFYIKRLVSKLKIQCLIYTFENHSWEKSILLFLRKYSPKTKIVGYQHARVMKSLLNYFPSQYERNLIPLPDKIITVGKHPKKILEHYGCYKNDLLISGCALRYEYLYDTQIIKRKPIKKVLIALTASLDESIQTVKFVQEGLKQGKYLPLYRCHPLISFDSIKSRFKDQIPGQYEISKEPSLKNDFLNSEAVLYTISTVCMEALMLGLPVIHVDLNEPINGDPLFECNFLRWIVKEPSQLAIVLDEINNLRDTNFYNQQNEAINYLKDYFKEVNEKNLKIFLKFQI